MQSRITRRIHCHREIRGKLANGRLPTRFVNKRVVCPALSRPLRFIARGRRARISYTKKKLFGSHSCDSSTFLSLMRKSAQWPHRVFIVTVSRLAVLSLRMCVMIQILKCRKMADISMWAMWCWSATAIEAFVEFLADTVRGRFLEVLNWFCEWVS